MRKLLALVSAALLFSASAFAQSTGGGGGGTSANPSAQVSTSAVNGTATTFMTSDSAPAINQAMAPTWTGLHTFNPGANNKAESFTLSNSGANTAVLGLDFSLTLNTSGSPTCVWLCITTFTDTTCGGNCNLINIPGTFSLTQFGTGTFTGAVNAGGNIVASNTGGTGSVGIAGTGCYNFANSMFCSTAATVSGTGLGSSPSITTNGSAAMDITVGTSPSAATFTITQVAVAHGWVCSGSDLTTPLTTNLKMAATGSTTTAVMENVNNSGVLTALTAGDHLRIQCTGY